MYSKADKMDEEAHTWITDWGPFVNPVISLFSLAMKPSIWTLEIVGLREPLAELGWHLYKNSVFYGLLSDQPGDDLVERSWASKNQLPQCMFNTISFFARRSTIFCGLDILSKVFWGSVHS